MVEIITNEVLGERLNTLIKDNKEQHGALQDSIADYGRRLRVLEDWKLVFVAKYSVYSAIALFLGSLMAQIAMQSLSKYV